MFINLKTDPCIPHSSPHCACVNLPPPIAFGLPLTSMLGRYSDSRSHPRSDTPRTPTHVCTWTLLGLLLTSALGHYSDSCSLPCSDSTQNPALVVLSIHLSEVLVCLTAIPYSHILTPLGALCLSVLQVLGTPLGRPLRHLCLNSSYKSEPAPSGPVWTSILIHVILVSTSLNPCLRTLFGPLSLSVLRFKPLPSNSARTSARVSAWTSVSRSVLQVQARAFGARSDLRLCPRYECRVDPNRS
jgi:hypothetical protein